MPIVALYYIPETPTHPPPSAVLADTLTRALHPLSAFRLQHSLHRHTSTAQMLQHLTHPSLPAATAHFLLVTPDNAAITTTAAFPALLKTHLGGLWTLRQSTRVEGMVYEDSDGGDFKVRVGRVLRGEKVAGTAVEVEWAGSGWEEGVGVARSWLEGLGVKGGVWIEAGGEGGKEREWSVMDTGRLWCELLRTR